MLHIVEVTASWGNETFEFKTEKQAESFCAEMVAKGYECIWTVGNGKEASRATVKDSPKDSKNTRLAR